MTGERAEPAVPRVPALQVGIRLGVSYREVRFAAPLLVIGRAAPGQAEPPQIDLSGDESVSRRHAEIRWKEDGFWLVDRGSTNGTWLNGQRLPPDEPRRLRDGDRVAVGRLSVLTIHVAGTQDADSPPSL